MTVKRLAFLETEWGKTITLCSRLLLYPILTVCLYAYTAWLDKHYVPRDEYISYKSFHTQESKESFIEIKSNFLEVNRKLDFLITNQATNAQRFIDVERRLQRVEDKIK